MGKEGYKYHFKLEWDIQSNIDSIFEIIESIRNSSIKELSKVENNIDIVKIIPTLTRIKPEEIYHA